MTHRQNNASGFQGDDRSLELAAAYALGVFDEQEERELREMFGGELDEIVRDFELAAAALSTALPGASPKDAIPEQLKDRLKIAGAKWSAGARRPGPTTDAPSLRVAGATPSTMTGGSRSTRPGWMIWGGWLAAAACLALAVFAWLPGRPTSLPGSDSGFAAEPGASQDRLETLRSRLIYWGAAEQGDAILASWTPLESPDPTAIAAGGDIVWSTTKQCGYMRIEGLASNDPGAFQYQLWIFDDEQKHPVDGGVFDVPPGAAGGAILIPVDPKIAVRKPTLFAVTIERPGGVVVSDRERIALIAPEPKPVAECLPDATSPSKRNGSAPRGRG